MTMPMVLALAASPLRASNSDWNNLKLLKQGTRTLVVVKGGIAIEGKLQQLDDEGITVRGENGDQRLPRKEIRWVSVRQSGNYKADIAAGITLGAMVGVALFLMNHNPHNDWWNSTWWIWPLSLGGGGGIGAGMAAPGWHVVYRARRH
jgi:hypothetical protein